jgi:hypothetical protein
MARRLRVPVTVTIDADLLEVMDQIRETQGTPISQMVDRALRLWLDSIGATPKKKAERQRTGTRRRP